MDIFPMLHLPSADLAIHSIAASKAVGLIHLGCYF